jgi:sugar/nucleoside kinase (ribokinase family)
VNTVLGISGGLSVDHLVHAPVGARFDCLGGPGLYAALAARLVPDVQVRLHCDLPRSTPQFTRVLRDAGIDITFAPQVEDVPRVWIVTAPEGRRIFSTSPPSGNELADIDARDLRDERSAPNAPFLAGLDGVLYCSPSSLPDTPSSTLVAVDPDQRCVQARGDGYWRAIAVPGGVLLPSRVQLAGIDPDPHRAARRLAAITGVRVIARLDADGMLAVDASGREWTVTDRDVHVVDTTGAGDASAGAITAALSAGADLAEAAAYGVSAARIVLSAWGHAALCRADPLTAPGPEIRIVEGWESL